MLLQANEASLMRLGCTLLETTEHQTPMPSHVEGEVDAEVEASEGGDKVRTTVDEVQDVGMPSSHSWKRGRLLPNAIACHS